MVKGCGTEATSPCLQRFVTYLPLPEGGAGLKARALKQKRPSEVTLVEDRPVAGGQSAARKAMIDSQLRTSGVNAPAVLARMAAVAREDFVPASARGIAYIDRAIALGDGRWLAAPLVQGMMLQDARPTQADKALLVDGGSGYLAV